jgi:myosin protein heavy chain
MIQKKEDEISQLLSDVTGSADERSRLQKEVVELQAISGRQRAEIHASRIDLDRTVTAKTKLEGEMDELRAIMETKTSEDARRLEVEKSKEEELAELRRQSSELHTELSVLRQNSLNKESKLNTELDKIQRQYAQLDSTHNSLLERERSLKERASKAEAMVVGIEKAKRALESELQALRSRQIDADGRLVEISRAKEVNGQSSVKFDESHIYPTRSWKDSSTLLKQSITRSRMQFCKWKGMLTLANASWKP